MIRKLLTSLLALAFLSAFAAPMTASDETTKGRAISTDEVAADYVRLALAIGRHEANFIDAYYGPAEWKSAAAAAEPRPLPELTAEAERLLAALAAQPAPAVETGEPDASTQGRIDYLRGQLGAVRAYLDILAGERLSFDAEAKALYGVTPPHFDAAYFDQRLAAVDAALPGEGPIGERYEAHRKRLEIPADRLDAVFRAAIDEARRRTRPHVRLPEGERFEVEFVTDKPWGGYNWYQGDGFSIIQVNTDSPSHLDGAVGLAAHEGYPGHHVYNALLERALMRDLGWVEFSVYLLFSPQSLIAEGTANFGVDVAFPGADKLAFERDVLAPLAGIDPAVVELQARLAPLLKELSFAGNEAARGYLDGKMSADEVKAWLIRYSFSTPERAARSLRFYDTYRSYVVNYNVGQELVRRWIESRGGTVEAPERRWQVFTDLLASPRLPAALAADLADSPAR